MCNGKKGHMRTPPESGHSEQLRGDAYLLAPWCQTRSLQSSRQCISTPRLLAESPAQQLPRAPAGILTRRESRGRMWAPGWESGPAPGPGCCHLTVQTAEAALPLWSLTA